MAPPKPMMATATHPRTNAKQNRPNPNARPRVIMMWLCVGTIASAAATTPLPTMSAESLRRELWATRDLFKTNVHTILRCGTGSPRFRTM